MDRNSPFMMMTKYILVFIIFSFLFGSCTIEKRRYQQGYNINWRNHPTLFAKKNHKNYTPKNELQSNFSIKKEIEKNIQPSVIENENKTNNYASNSTVVINGNFFDLLSHAKKANHLSKSSYSIKINKKLKKELAKILNADGKNLNDKPNDNVEAKFATPAMVLGIMSFVSLILLFIFPESLGLAFLTLLTPILAIIFGSMAKAKIKDNPNLKGKGKARFAFATGLTLLTLYVVVLLALIIFLIVVLDGSVI